MTRVEPFAPFWVKEKVQAHYCAKAEYPGMYGGLGVWAIHRGETCRNCWYQAPGSKPEGEPVYANHAEMVARRPVPPPEAAKTPVPSVDPHLAGCVKTIQELGKLAGVLVPGGSLQDMVDDRIRDELVAARKEVAGYEANRKSLIDGFAADTSVLHGHIHTKDVRIAALEGEIEKNAVERWKALDAKDEKISQLREMLAVRDKRRTPALIAIMLVLGFMAGGYTGGSIEALRAEKALNPSYAYEAFQRLRVCTGCEHVWERETRDATGRATPGSDFCVKCGAVSPRETRGQWVYPLGLFGRRGERTWREAGEDSPKIAKEGPKAP